MSVSAWRVCTTFCRGRVTAAAAEQFADLLLDKMADDGGSVADFNAAGTLLSR